MKRKSIFLFFLFSLVLSATVLTQSAQGSCAPKRAKINVKKLTLAKGDRYTLRAYNTKRKQTVRFTSSDPTIVTVTENERSKHAEITAIGIGNAVVYTNIYSTKGKLIRSLKTRIQITPLAISIKFAQRKVRTYVDDSTKLSVIIKPNTSLESPVYETSDEEIVTVNSKGIITAVAPGEAVITATLLSSGQKTKCLIEVLDDSEFSQEE